MAIRDIFKVNRKTFLNPSAWIDLNSLRFSNRTIKEILTDVLTPIKPAEKKETFDEAVKRLGLTDKDVQEAGESYLTFSYLFAILGALALLFGFYLLFKHGTFTGWLLAFASSALFMSQAFKFNFWSFQIKHKKLGCTFDEWKRGKPDEKGPIQ